MQNIKEMKQRDGGGSWHRVYSSWYQHLDDKQHPKSIQTGTELAALPSNKFGNYILEEGSSYVESAKSVR